MFCRVLENKDLGIRTVKQRKRERAFVLDLGLGGRSAPCRKINCPTTDVEQVPGFEWSFLKMFHSGNGRIGRATELVRATTSAVEE